MKSIGIIGLFAGITFVAIIFVPQLFSLRDTTSLNSSLSPESELIFTDVAMLRRYMQEFGVEQSVKQLDTLSRTMGSCHDQAHKAGRLAYDLHGADAFRLCSAECHSGCYHGATEAYFKEFGTANLQEDLQLLCSADLNSFFSHQCLHGIGHGLMAWTNYELFDALEACNLLSNRRDSCWSGVFMENYVGGLFAEEGHASNYLNDDPLYPCTAVEEVYKNTCYFLQTSRMIQILGTDFEKIASACLAAPEAHQRACFASMGRDVGGVNRFQLDQAIAACDYAPEGEARLACLGGAVQDTFWDPGGQDTALLFCRLLTDHTEKSECYRTIFDRAPNVLASQDDLETFCNNAEADWHDLCVSTGGL